MIEITKAGPADIPDWHEMRDALWPHAAAENAAEIAAQIDNPETVAFIARDAAGRALGFAEGAIRHDYVNGCDSSPVGFLEGIYVMPDARRIGVARRLVAALAEWSRQHDCQEMASDADIDNAISHQMHDALGFTETQRVVFFRRAL